MSTDFNTDFGLLSRAVAAREIKRRGIGAPDPLLVDGPVYVVRNDEIKYVLLSEARYRKLLEEAEEATWYWLKESEADIAAGRVTVTTAEELIKEFGLDEP